MAKLTAAELVARTEKIKADAELFKTLWQDSFPPDLPSPPDWEIRNAVRRLDLADLEKGIESYLVLLSEGTTNPTSKNALRYVCGTAWRIKEQEDPAQEFHPTARRIRNAQRDPNSSEWDGESFGNASPEERQAIMAEIIARQKAGVQG